MPDTYLANARANAGTGSNQSINDTARYSHSKMPDVPAWMPCMLTAFTAPLVHSAAHDVSKSSSCVTSSMIMTMLCSSQCFLRVDRKSGGGATKPPSPRMGSMMMAAVSSGAVCILSIHLKASWGPRQQRRASYSSKGGMLGDTCATWFTCDTKSTRCD